jgi:2-polyprenyl-6-hydroxyphenyl methylase/3-demethylubiquinone-9 3-methyltransferase
MNKEEINKKMYFYESFAEDFDSKMNMYDTQKRVKVFFEEMLKDEDLENKMLLDAGCGTGWFSKAACEKGANVFSMDLGEKLLQKVAEKCNSHRVVGSILEIPFPDNTFDYVISSEVIEHVPEPYKAIHEIYRVLKPGGIMVISTPNKFWKWTLWIANIFKLRPYQGLENWSGFFQLKKEVNKTGFTILKTCGVHIIPFVHPATYPINDFFHRWNDLLAPFMVNLAIKAKK